ncbi:4 [Hexamita inflata]|uniref:4 n=1 Tax=Hexamita inflata TaxID=28002 RepID=A0AA86PBG9_9EUKA|nr:4 [Hexamita inflata] [Hexamita inflata]
MELDRKDLYSICQENQFLWWRLYDKIRQNDYKQLEFQILTFNVAEKTPQQIFKNLLEPGKQLYVIALEEVSMTAMTILSSQCKETEQYVNFVKEVLPKHQTVYHQLGGLLLIVAYVDVTIEAIFTVATGKGGMSNKGGTNIFIRYQNTRYLFTGCHLSAQRGKTGPQKRNSDLYQITQIQPELETTYTDLLQENRGSGQCLTQFYNYPKLDSYIYDSQEHLTLFKKVDFVFIFGDLNYRVQNDHCIDLIKQGKQAELLKFDELICQINVREYKFVQENDITEYSSAEGDEKEATQFNFKGFQEEPIKFLPTYKIHGKGYNPERIPSYCDRIIFKQINRDINITVNKYTSVPTEYSDHYPVTLVGKIDARPMPENNQSIVDAIKKDYQTLLQQLKPIICLSRQEITFNECKYGHIYSAEIGITNTHLFSTATLAVINVYDHIQIAQNQITVKPKQIVDGKSTIMQSKLQIYVQISQRNVQAGTYVICLQDHIQTINIKITIGKVNYDILTDTEANNKRLNDAFNQHFKKNGFKQTTSQADINQFYDAVEINKCISIDPNVIFREYLKYINLLQFIQEPQLTAISQIDVKDDMSMKDMWPRFETILNNKQKEQLTQIIQILMGKSIVDGVEEISRVAGPVVFKSQIGVKLLKIMLK